MSHIRPNSLCPVLPVNLLTKVAAQSSYKYIGVEFQPSEPHATSSNDKRLTQQRPSTSNSSNKKRDNMPTACYRIPGVPFASSSLPFHSLPTIRSDDAIIMCPGGGPQTNALAEDSLASAV
eukprot:GHVT01008908.1.p1 GENE.GHVT01008908.1~~GHVT01008908.1.p1  ORF type:complete len:121 (+),score=8.53 GHVT01008908.1:248-610(+)